MKKKLKHRPIIKTKHCIDCNNLIRKESTRCQHCCGIYNGRKRIQDLSGKKFNLLTVLSYLPIRKDGRVLWKCKCDCGSECNVSTKHLTSKQRPQKSCGCLRFLCNNKNPKWSGYKEISGAFWGRTIRSASTRKHKFEITVQFAWKLFLEQDKKCALSGLPIYFGKMGRDLGTASLDRINSSLNYTQDNVQWVHKDINKMKNIFGEKYFIKLCHMVSHHNS